MFFEAKYRTFNKPKDFIKAAMGTLRYISRKGVEPVWGNELYSMEEAKEIIHARAELWPRRRWIFKLSPDIKEENPNKDLDLWEMARNTLDYIRNNIDPDVTFIFAEHNDTNIPHVQGLVFFNGRLERHDLDEMKKLAHEYALEQQEQNKEIRQSISRLQASVQRVQKNSRSTEGLMVTNSRPLVGMAGGRANHFVGAYKMISHRRMRKPKELTPPCPNGRGHAVVKWKGKNWCQNCEKVLEQSMGLGF